MKKISLLLIITMVFHFNQLFSQATSPIIIDHSCCGLSKIPENFITLAKQNYRIAYGHTSHGSQIVSGMTLLKSNLYNFGTGSGQLYFLDNGIPGASDLGNPDRTAWATATRNLLTNNTNKINMIIWSWCGQANTSEANIQTYLDLMDGLENDFPTIKFVYMTGHLYTPSGGGCVNGNNNLRNEQIRQFCRYNNKILFDFADIESYNPDGEYFLDDCADDGCNYYNSQGVKIGNWAEEWCDAHPGECDDCSCAHSHCLNCQQKGKAFWWMMARVAGWDGVAGSTLASPTLKSPNPGIADDDGFLSMEWDPVNNANEYNIQIADENTFTLPVVDEWVPSTNYSAEGLELGKSYFWKVRARNVIVTGSWSNINNFTTRLAKPLLKYPLNNDKIQGTDVSLEWDSVLNADEYEVQVSDTSNFSRFTANYKGINLRFVPSNLVSGKTYYWRVRANNEVITSYWSEIHLFSCLNQEQNELLLSIDSLDFGSINIGSSSTLSFAITNIGTVDIEISDIRIIGSGASGFLLLGNNLTATLSPTDSREFIIKFLPANTGVFDAEISIINSSFNSPVNFKIQGTAIPSTDVNEFVASDTYEIECIPNPAKNELIIELNLKDNPPEKAQIKIVDINGRTVLETSLQGLKKGNNVIPKDVSTLNNGQYFVIINYSNKLISAPFILMK